MKARIEFIGGKLDGKQMTITKTTFIGRHEQCDIVLTEDRTISKKHAVLQFTSEGYVLEDLGSTNGTYIDEQAIKQPTLLSNGKHFRLGKTFLKITYP